MQALSNNNWVLAKVEEHMRFGMMVIRPGRQKKRRIQ